MNIAALRLDANPIAVKPFNNGGFSRTTSLKSLLHNRKLVVCSSVKSVSSTVAAESTGEGLSRIGSLSQVSGVLGCQWGDEGKGKLVDILAKHFDIVARCQVILPPSFLVTLHRVFCIVFSLYICIYKCMCVCVCGVFGFVVNVFMHFSFMGFLV